MLPLADPSSLRKTVSRSVRLFLHGWQQRVAVGLFYNGAPPFRLIIALSHGGSEPTWFFGPIRILNPNGMSIGWAVSAGLTSLTDRPKDRPRYLVGSNRLHLRTYVVLRCGLIILLNDRLSRKPSLEVAPITLAIFFIIWPWTLTYYLDLQIWPRYVNVNQHAKYLHQPLRQQRRFHSCNLTLSVNTITSPVRQHKYYVTWCHQTIDIIGCNIFPHEYFPTCLKACNYCMQQL